MRYSRPPMASRSSPDVRRASLLLSGLVLTGDDSLEAFRNRRVGDPSLDIDHLKRARDILDAVHEAITSGDDPGRWERVEKAWQILIEREASEAPPPAVSPAASATAPPPVAAGPRPSPPAPGAITPSHQADVKVEVSDSTLPVDGPQPGDRTVLPFAGAVAEPPPSAVADVKEAVDQLSQTTMGDTSGANVTLPFKLPPGLEPPAPEGPPLPSHLSGLNIEHYAALCAARDVYKGWESQVEARYGITNEADKQAVDAHFRAQMKSDASQMQAWRKGYARVEAWARDQRGQ